MNEKEEERYRRIKERRDKALEEMIVRRLKDLEPEALDRISAAISEQKERSKK